MFMCVPEYMFMYPVSSGAHRGQNRLPDPLVLGLQAVVILVMILVEKKPSCLQLQLVLLTRLSSLALKD